MFVKSIMKPKHQCVVVQAEDSLETVLKLLESKGIDGVPVLNGDTYEGIVTKNSIYENYFKFPGSRDDFLQQIKAKNIATHQEELLGEDELFEKTLLKLKDFPLLPVVDFNKNFMGIVTRYDFLELFQSAFGMKRQGIRITCTSVETEGRIAKLTEIAHQYHVHIISLVTFDEDDQLVRRIVLKVGASSNLEKFTKKLQEAGFRILHISEQ